MSLPVMTAEELGEFITKNDRWPFTEEFVKKPVTWLPIKPSNPSKLTAHYFENGKWVRLPYVKFIPWPEVWG